MKSQREALPAKINDLFSIDENNFEESVPKLKLLKGTDRHVQLQAVKTLLGPCVALCSSALLGETILNEAALVGRELFVKTIDDIESILSTADDWQRVAEKLGYCEDVLNVWLQCLEELEKFKKLLASETRGVLENIVEVIKRSFEHCKASQQISGTLSAEATKKLTSLFRNTNQLQNSFCALLEQVIKFNTDVEADVFLLAKVIRFIGEISLIVDGLAIKSVVDSWRGFTKIALTYSDDLKIHTPPCVTPHLKSLANSVSLKVTSIAENVAKNNSEREMKLVKILIKVLEKLCSSYCGHLGKDVACAMIELLVQLARYSPSCLKILDVDPTTINCAASNFPTITDEFLDILLNDSEFREAFVGHETTNTANNVGYHFLTLAVISKIFRMELLSPRMWQMFFCNILEIVLDNVNALREHLVLDQLRYKSLSLYDATLVAMCGIVVYVEQSNFTSVENALLKHVLGGEFWSSLLATDIWCFIDKYGSQELCYDHLVYLMEVYETLIDRIGCFEVIVLESLISRIYTNCAEETRNRLTDTFETTTAHVWLPLRRCISPHDKSYLSLIISDDIADISATWKTLNENPTAEIWNRFTKELVVTRLFGDSSKDTVGDTLSNIWNCIVKSDDVEGVSSYLIGNLTTILLDCTLILEDQNKNLATILAAIGVLPSRGGPRLRAQISHYLREANEQFLSCDAEVTSILARLYCLLLKDSDPWILQEALESFSDFTNNASYSDELVHGILDHVANIPEISEIISSYVSRSPKDSLAGFASLEAYMKKLCRVCDDNSYRHECYERGESPNRDKRRKLVGSPVGFTAGNPVDVNRLVKKLSDDVDNILMRKYDLCEASMKQLDLIAKKILSSKLK